MLKKIFGALALALVAVSSSAQFSPNQVLRAQDLNAALAAPTITGGSINGAPIGGTSPRGITATTVYAGTVTSPKFVGTITGVVTGTATYAASAGTAVYAVSAGAATTASTAARATTATYATNAGTATLAGTATTAGTSTYATNAGTAYTLNGTTFAAPGPIGATVPSTGVFTTLRASAADASSPMLGVSGTTKGIRFNFNSTASSIEGVENTLGGSYQPLLLVGSTAGLYSAGTGAVSLGTNNGTPQAYVTHTASAVNALVVTGGATGNPVALSTFGSDTNRGITLTPAGTGTVAVAGPLSVSGQASFAAGSAAAPTVKVGGEQNGLYSDGAGSLSAVTAGARVVRFGTAGGTGNYLRLDADNTPLVTAVAGATNADLGLASAGTGSILLATNGSISSTQFRIAHTASAVNYVQATGAATGNFPVLFFTGADANVNGGISTKGTGGIGFYSNSANNLQVLAANTTSAVNYLQLTGSVTGSPVAISTGGSDTNRGIRITAAGTGTVQVSGHQVVTGPTAPTVASGAGDCGTSPAIAGRDGAMRITVGSSTNGGVCTVTFGHAWATAPVCVASSESGIMAVRTTATTTTVAVAATLLSPADKLTVICMGY